MFLRASLKESQYAIYYYIYKCKKNKKVIQIFYKDLSTRYDSFFDYDENRSFLSNVVYGTLTKNWRKHKIYFYIYEDTKNIGT